MELDLSQSADMPKGFDRMEMPNLQPSYPCLYLTCEGVEDLPDSGTMKVKYRVKGRSMKEHKGETSHSVDLELLSIKSPKKQKDVVSGEDDQEAMEDL